MLKQNLFLLNKEIFPLIVIIFLFNCNRQYKECNDINILNFDYEISKPSINIQDPIYCINGISAKIIKIENLSLININVYIFDYHEQKILGIIQIKGDTIELSYKHKKSNWIKDKIFGISLLSEFYVLKYSICGIKRNRKYIIKFVNPNSYPITPPSILEILPNNKDGTYNNFRPDSPR
jgi:hypothetical protein